MKKINTLFRASILLILLIYQAGVALAQCVIENKPTDIMVSADAGECTAVVSWTEPTKSIACPDTPTVPNIPEDYDSLGMYMGNYYYLSIPGNLLTYEATKTAIASIPDVNVYLTTITSIEENNVVLNWLLNVDGNQEVWIGLSTSGDLDDSDSYSWGNGDTSSYRNWYTDRPNFDGPFVRIKEIDQGRWHNTSAEALRRALLEIESDPNSATLTRTQGLASGNTFPVGNTEIEYTLVHDGDTTKYSFTITVEDNEAPTFPNCPDNITIDTTTSVQVFWNEPIASDNCGIEDSTATHSSGASFPLGVTTVEYSAIDLSGNVGICSFSIRIGGEINPPRLLTPNGDGSNDTWSINMLDNYTVKIFNRSGGLVCELNSSNPEWDGQNAPDGVYFYVIEPIASNSKGEILKGPIMLIRNP